MLSPFAPDHDAFPWQFLERNGIVAGLADAVVVIEAPARSGALNTAGWAAGGIPVLAVPGDVDRPHVAGCHALIRDGATLARGPGDVLEALGFGAKVGSLPVGAPAIDDPLQRAILEQLAVAQADLSALVLATGASTGEVVAAISILELSGIVESTDGGRYATLVR